MVSPLQIWQSQKVTQLLYEQYFKNFLAAGVANADTFTDKLVNFTFENKDKLSEIELLDNISQVFKNVRKLDTLKATEINVFDLFDIGNPKVFLDYGANKLKTTNRIAKKYPNLEKIYATDVVIPKEYNFVSPEKFEYLQINPENSKVNLANASVDFINIQFVLHHVLNDKIINQIIQEVFRILKPNGKLLLWEETFENKIDVDQLVEKNNKLGILTDKDLTEKFYNLTKEQRFEYILANDWLINPGNEHMQWTNIYKSFEEWSELFQKHGFKMEKYYNMGLRVNGHVKTGVHVLTMFGK